jgi:hypothetical protein
MALSSAEKQRAYRERQRVNPELKQQYIIAGLFDSLGNVTENIEGEQ